MLNAGLKIVQKCFKYNCVVLFLFCLQVLNEKKLQEVDSLWKEFETPEKANKM